MRKVIYEYKEKLIDFHDDNRLLGINLRSIDSDVPYGYTSLRYPGGDDAKQFVWEDNTETLDDLVSTMNNHPTLQKLVYVINLSDTDDSIVECLKYLCKRPIGQSSIDSKRVYVELGNEPYADDNWNDKELYSQRVNELIAKIEEIGPFAGILLPMEVSFQKASWINERPILRDWNGYVSENVKGATHYAGHFYSTQADGVNLFPSTEALRGVDLLERTIDDIYPSKPWCITEYGVWEPSLYIPNFDRDAFFFAMLAKFSTNQKVELMQYWNLDESAFAPDLFHKRFMEVHVPSFNNIKGVNNVVMNSLVPFSPQYAIGNLPRESYVPDAIVGRYCGKIIIVNVGDKELTVEVEEGAEAEVFAMGKMKEVLWDELELSPGDILLIGDDSLTDPTSAFLSLSGHIL